MNDTQNNYAKSAFSLTAIPFYEDMLWADATDQNHHVAVKPICETLQIDWEAQRQRIARDEILAEGACMIQVPSPGGVQETTCLPLHLIPGFLFGIEERRIKNELIRKKVLRYKRECYAVLFKHFFGVKETSQPIDLGTDINTRLRTIEVAERLYGKAAARTLWLELGFPISKGEEAHSKAFKQDIDSIADFLENGVTYKPGIITYMPVMYEAYVAYCKDNSLARQKKDIFERRARIATTEIDGEEIPYIDKRYRARFKDFIPSNPIFSACAIEDWY